jgi:hypothetical protein
MKLQKMCGQKQKKHVVKIEKEYCKENCIDRSVIEPIIIDFCDDVRQVVLCIIYVL